MTLKAKVYDFLNDSKMGSVVLGALIIFSIGIFSAETEYTNNAVLLKANLVIASIFGVEYILRIWSANHAAVPSARTKYITSFYGVIDLIAFLPALILPLFNVSLLLRLLRMLRLLQLLKIRSLTRGLSRVMKAVDDSKSELAVTVLMSTLLIFIGAVLMYFVEGKVQPEQFGSIPRALWWSIATLTTVGYGDVYPITAAGRLLASIIALVGIAAVAMPSGILAAAFMKAK